MTEEKREFKIGLSMSGAISAGAYSAGVFDFLIQALEEWEKAKKSGQDDIPKHSVIIAAMAGASAGSITSSVGALAACRGALPAINDNEAYRVLPDLYTAWVARPDFLTPITSFNGVKFGSLLSTEDLDETSNPEQPIKVVSLLNSKPLRYIADEAISAIGARNSNLLSRPYFPVNLHLYMTLTNLRGVLYEINFSAGDCGTSTNPYGMMCHRDWVHYRLDQIGTANFPSPWADGDPVPKPLDISTIPNINPIAEPNWSAYIEYTLASSAFPVGLSARLLENELPIYKGRYWPLPFELENMKKVVPKWPAQWGPNPPVFPATQYKFAAIDGGIIDNDPFQFVRYALMSNPPNGLDRKIDSADRTVIMISPFPEPPEFELNYKDTEACGLLEVIKQIIPMLIQQNRLKLEEVSNALDTDIASRWLISPRRYKQNYELETYGIACGLLGGFGGFLEREFREHDYELGRKNCQDFLARWFGLPEENPKVDHRVAMPLEPGKRNGEQAFSPPKFPIIPLYGTAVEKVQVRSWPRVNKQKVDDFTAQAMVRLERLREVLTANSNLGYSVRFWLLSGWKLGMKDKLEELVRYSMLGDLILRDQLDDKTIIALTVDERKVLHACIDPTYDYRSAAGIVRLFNGRLTEQKVQEILDNLKSLGLVDKFWRGVKDGKLIGRVGSLFDSDSKPIYTYVDRQKSIMGMPSDPTFDF